MKKSKLAFSICSSLLLVLAVFSSCSKDDKSTNDEQTTPAKTSDLAGLYTCEDIFEYEDYIRMALCFNADKSMFIYVDTTYSDGYNGDVFNGEYEYDPDEGYGTIKFKNGSDADFYADEQGFIIFVDEDSKFRMFNDGIWLGKQSYDFETFNEEPEWFECEYDDDFGCESYDTACVLDIDDIGYQFEDSAAPTRASTTLLTIGGMFKWAIMNLSPSSASLRFDAIYDMSQETVSMMNDIIDQLNDIQGKLDIALKGIDQILSRQAVEHFNAHKSDRNELRNMIRPFIKTVLAEKDSVKRSALLQQCFNQKVTISTATFLDNIQDITFDDMKIYSAYDKFVYQNYIWEEQGYVPRESFRSIDMMLALEGTILSVLYYSDQHNLDMVKDHLQKFQNYLKYYESVAVVRNNEYAISQIKDLKIKIRKELDHRDFINQNWLKIGTDFDPSGYIGGYLVENSHYPGITITQLAYGHNSMSTDKYSHEGLTENEIKTLINAHPKINGKDMPLQTILFDYAKCKKPDTSRYQNLYVMRAIGRPSGTFETIGLYADETKMEIAAYTPADNDCKLRHLCVPYVKKKEYSKWRFISRMMAPKVFAGWKEFVDDSYWCYPIVVRTK